MEVSFAAMNASIVAPPEPFRNENSSSVDVLLPKG
jgi:hypothetical protein